MDVLCLVVWDESIIAYNESSYIDSEARTLDILHVSQRLSYVSTCIGRIHQSYRYLLTHIL